MCESSGMGSLDFVKKFLATEPVKNKGSSNNETMK